MQELSSFNSDRKDQSMISHATNLSLLPVLDSRSQEDRSHNVQPLLP